MLTPVSTSSNVAIQASLAGLKEKRDFVAARLKDILGNLKALFTVHFLQNFAEGTREHSALAWLLSRLQMDFYLVDVQ